MITAVKGFESRDLLQPTIVSTSTSLILTVMFELELDWCVQLVPGAVKFCNVTSGTPTVVSLAAAFYFSSSTVITSFGGYVSRVSLLGTFHTSRNGSIQLQRVFFAAPCLGRQVSSFLLLNHRAAGTPVLCLNRVHRRVARGEI